MNLSPRRVLFGRTCTATVVAPLFISLLLSSLSADPCAAAAAEDPPKMCVMLYMMADNDLELAIMQDLFEYFDSDAIVQPNVKTWIYWDGHGGYDYDGDGEGDHTLILGGEPAIVPHYLTYDHEIQDILSYPLDGEQNSDAPQVLCDFLYTALANCLEFGATEFMLAFSSHGNGHQGFGGDDNIGRRRLLQSNRDIQRALGCALDSASDLPNAPRSFDVIGFDACLMQDFLTTRDYSPYTKYFMASEATEPGHGWWWNISSSAAGGALNMATELMDGFLTQTQNPEGTHLVPKTLSIVDTISFETFLVEFESFVTELADLLWYETDQNFFAAIQRSRSSVVAFESAADHPGSRDPSAVDVGSFLSIFNELCSPTGTLKESYDRTLEAYEGQFHARGYGEGTKPSSGMAVWFPSKRVNPWSVEDEIVMHIDDGETSYAWLDFIDVFLNSTSPLEKSTSSVCANSLSSDIEARYKDQLLLNPQIYLANVGIEVQSEITIETDFVLTEYGFYFDDLCRRRRLESIGTLLAKVHAPITPIGKRLERNRFGKEGRNFKPLIHKETNTRRSVQEDVHPDDYLILYNGAMSDRYQGSSYTGFWDELVYVLFEDTPDGALNTFIYADNLGDGMFSIPVVYFPSDIEVDSAGLPPLGSVVEDALALGGVYGELEFSTHASTGQVISSISLYIDVEGGSATFEKPRSQGGSLAPVVYGEISVVGEDLAFVELVGSLHAWNDDLSVQPVDVDTYSDLIDLDFMVFDMWAYDFDKSLEEDGHFDYYFFDFNITERTLNSSIMVYDDDYYLEHYGSTTGSAGKDVMNNDQGPDAGTATSNAASAVPGLVLLPCLLSFLICSWSRNIFL